MYEVFVRWTEKKVAVSGGSQCKGKTATTKQFGQLDPFVWTLIRKIPSQAKTIERKNITNNQMI